MKRGLDPMNKPFHKIVSNQQIALLVLLWMNSVGSQDMNLVHFIDVFRERFQYFNKSASTSEGSSLPSNRAIRRLVNHVATQYPNIQLTMRKTDDPPQVWYINQPTQFNQVSESDGTPPNLLPRYPFNSKVAFINWKDDTFIDLTILPFPKIPQFNPDFLTKKGKKFLETLETLFSTNFYIINWCRRQPEVIS